MGRFPLPAATLRAGSLGCFALLVVLLLVPAKAGAQGGDACDVPSHGGVVINTLSNQSRMLSFKRPTIRCPGGVRISADSAMVFEATNYNQLWGNVVFWDEDSRLSADQAQYFSDQRRLVAQGNTVLRDLAEGSVIEGDNMTLVRAGPNQPEDDLTVYGGRPHARLFPSQRPVPEEVLPDTVTMPPDSGAVPPDTLLVPSDSAAALPDSAAVLPDSAAVLPDSAAVLPDSAAAPPDSIVQTPQEIPAPTPPIMFEGPEGELPPEAERIPYEIDAQRFVLQGTRYFRAIGSVLVTRDSLEAVADSLEYDQEAGALFLSREARVTTAETDLSADAIRLDIPQDEVRGALATGNAILVGEDLRLLSPILSLAFTGGRVERLVAVRDAVADSIVAEMDDEELERERLRRGAPPLVARELGFSEFPRRPYALAQDFILEGDSVEVIAPGEIIEEARAMGNARGEAVNRDSLATQDTLALISRDWMEGDTIVAFFGQKGDSLAAPEEPLPDEDPVVVEVAEGDTTGPGYLLKRLLALGNARSMYRMAASDSAVVAEGGRYAIHYVIGDEITIILNPEGEAERMEVVGQTRGIHLEPLPRRGEPADTVAVPDTSGVGRGSRGPGGGGFGAGSGSKGGGPGG